MGGIQKNNSLIMGSILSIDYGLKRIGIAISDPERIFAFPQDFIENKNFTFVASRIKEIVCEREISLIIIGLPHDQRIKSQELRAQRQKKPSMQNIILDFAKKLQKQTEIPIKTIDESFTSFIANENLKECKVSSKKSRKLIDSEAARLILEDFIQQNNH